MAIFEKIKGAMAAKDAEAMIALLHDDFVIVRHQSGTELDRDTMAAMMRDLSGTGDWSVENHRCLYENDDIMVEHSVMTFPDGSKEAVLVANTLKDGKIVRMETGATTLG